MGWEMGIRSPLQDPLKTISKCKFFCRILTFRSGMSVAVLTIATKHIAACLHFAKVTSNISPLLLRSLTFVVSHCELKRAKTTRNGSFWANLYKTHTQLLCWSFWDHFCRFDLFPKTMSPSSYYYYFFSFLQEYAKLKPKAKYALKDCRDFIW